MADELVSHAFSHGFHPNHTERLAAYWSEAWGGPPTYTKNYGSESSVVRMHSGNGEHEQMDQRAISCFEIAMSDVDILDNELREALFNYFVWTTRKSMAAYPNSAKEVPQNLQVPHWSWDGLQK
jgi:hemoglobin